jgi:hypothetical protein
MIMNPPNDSNTTAGNAPAFTPGPWIIDTVSDSTSSRRIGSSKDKQASGFVARVYGANPDQVDANARLIAAAPELPPELLAALQTFKDAYLSPNYRIAVEAAFSKACAAIAKATGQP